MAQENNDPFVIDIMEPIGADWFGNGMTEKRFAYLLKQAGKDTPVTVRLNSPGGDAFMGISIYNLMREHKAGVTVEIIGLAASAASIIAVGGNQVKMAANATMMIHEPWTISMGNAADMRKTAEMLETINEGLINTYASRIGNDQKKKISKLLADETWLTAKESLELGLVDEITGDAEADAPSAAVLAKFKKVPESILARVTGLSNDMRQKMAHASATVSRIRARA
jgi:ATP-dependent Clp protease protease subunit